MSTKIPLNLQLIKDFLILISREQIGNPDFSNFMLVISIRLSLKLLQALLLLMLSWVHVEQTQIPQMLGKLD